MIYDHLNTPFEFKTSVTCFLAKDVTVGSTVERSLAVILIIFTYHAAILPFGETFVCENALNQLDFND